jgi:hypothetical protein
VHEDLEAIVAGVVKAAVAGGADLLEMGEVVAPVEAMVSEIEELSGEVFMRSQVKRSKSTCKRQALLPPRPA